MFGFFGNKKKEEQPNKITKEEAGQDFNDYVKKLMSVDKNGYFFMLVRNSGFGGKAIVGDGPMMEDLFGQLFHEHPEVLGLMKEIISRYESGKAVFRTGGTTLPVDEKVAELARKNYGVDTVNINRQGPFQVTNPNDAQHFGNPTPEEQKALGGLLKSILGKENDETPDMTDPLYPRHEMKKEHDKYQKKLKDKGLDGFDLDEIRKRNKE